MSLIKLYTEEIMKRFFIFLLVLGLIMVTACSDKDEEDLRVPITIEILQDGEESTTLGEFTLDIFGAASKPYLWIGSKERVVEYDVETNSYYAFVSMTYGQSYELVLLIDEDERVTNITVPHKVNLVGALPANYNGTTAATVQWSIGNNESFPNPENSNITQSLALTWGPPYDGIYHAGIWKANNMYGSRRTYTIPAGTISNTNWETATLKIVNQISTEVEKVSFYIETSVSQTVENPDGGTDT